MAPSNPVEFVRRLANDQTLLVGNSVLDGGPDWVTRRKTTISADMVERSVTVALWNAGNEIVAAVHFPDWTDMNRYCRQRRLHYDQGNVKVYGYHGLGVNAGSVGNVMEYEMRVGVWAGCGNHFLKTT